MNGRLTITEVAKYIGVTPRTIMRWEKMGKIKRSRRDWRGWIGASMQTLASGSSDLPARPAGPDDAALGRIARQIELMAGTVQRSVA